MMGDGVLVAFFPPSSCTITFGLFDKLVPLVPTANETGDGGFSIPGLTYVAPKTR
jgi:hypothetical protein